MATQQQIDFAREIYRAAKKATDIAPDFVTAQAILESGWGKSRVGRFNLFGITRGSAWKGKTVLVLTHEYFNTPDRKFNAPERVVSIAKCKVGNRWYYTVYRLFKDFDSLEECLQEHHGCSGSPVMPTHGHTARMPSSSPAASATDTVADTPPPRDTSHRWLD